MVCGKVRCLLSEFIPTARNEDRYGLSGGVGTQWVEYVKARHGRKPKIENDDGRLVLRNPASRMVIRNTWHGGHAEQTENVTEQGDGIVVISTIDG